MSLLDISVYTTIAISYNIFVHHLATTIYKNLPYNEKYNKSLIFIFVAGLIGIVVSKLILSHNDEYKKSVVSMGLGIGGILLIITAILTNWNDLTDEIRLFISASLFCTLVYYFYNYYDRSNKSKINTKVTEIVNIEA